MVVEVDGTAGGRNSRNSGEDGTVFGESHLVCFRLEVGNWDLEGRRTDEETDRQVQMERAIRCLYSPWMAWGDRIPGSYS